MREVVELQLTYNALRQGVDLYFLKRDTFHDTTKIAKPAEFVDYDPGQVVEPTAFIPDGGFQKLMDALWRTGVRPTDSARLDSVVEAKDAHITDLRNILMKFLRMK